LYFTKNRISFAGFNTIELLKAYILDHPLNLAHNKVNAVHSTTHQQNMTLKTIVHMCSSIDTYLNVAFLQRQSTRCSGNDSSYRPSSKCIHKKYAYSWTI